MIKSDLATLLKKSPSLPFLFVGSGVSRRYIDTENWEDLLRYFAKFAQPELDLPFESYQDKLRNNINNTDPYKLFPAIATAIEHDFNQRWHVDKEWAKSRKNSRKFIQEGVSPFKMEVSNYLQSKKILEANLGEDLKNELELLRSISNQSIAGIITTNYDNFLESIFPDFQCFIGQEQLLFSNPQNIGEIYKIHGCCSEPSTIVLTHNDYNSFKQKNPYLASKLLTIFVEHPIIFIGYSLQDQNIQDILEALVFCLSPEKLDQFAKQLIFIKYDKNINSPEMQMQLHTISLGNPPKPLTITSISTSNFANIFTELRSVTSQFSIPMLRKIKEALYNIIIEKDSPRKRLAVHDFENLNFNSDKLEFVAGVGVLREIGYMVISPHKIFTDIVLNNEDFNAEKIALETVPYLLPRHGYSLPFYKYIKDLNYDNLPECYSTECHSKGTIMKSSVDGFLSRSRQKKRDNNKIYFSLKDILNSKLHLTGQIENILCLSETELPLVELEAYLSTLLRENPDILTSNSNPTAKTALRTLIRIFDWRKYAKK